MKPKPRTSFRFEFGTQEGATGRSTDASRVWTSALQGEPCQIGRESKPETAGGWERATGNESQ